MKKLIIGIIAVLLTVPMFAVFTPQALAHHSTVSGKVACVKIDGQSREVVTWTITNSESNHTEKITALSSSVFGVQVGNIIGVSGHITGFQSFSGNTTGDKTLTVSGKWSDNVTNTNSGTVHLEGNCLEKEPTPTPTIPCGQQVIVDIEKIQTVVFSTPCVTPTVTLTATPSATPTPGQPGNPPTFQGSSTNAPGAATCNIPFDKPNLYGFKLGNSGEATFIWFDIQSVDKFSIVYGNDKDHLIYGEDNIPGGSWPVRSITLHGLKPGLPVFAKVGAWRGGCEEESDILDPIVL